jgi:hypothetical protein
MKLTTEGVIRSEHGRGYFVIGTEGDAESATKRRRRSEHDG